MRKIIPAVVVGLLLCSCASTFISSYSDTPERKGRKRLNRALFDVATLGTAEIVLSPKARRIHRVELFRMGLTQTRTLSDLIHFTGFVPRCRNTERATQACSWSFDRRAYGATTVYVGYGIFITQPVVYGRMFSLVCTLPRDGTARALGTCSYTQRGGHLGPEQPLVPYEGVLPPQLAYLEETRNAVSLPPPAPETQTSEECALRVKAAIQAGRSDEAIRRILDGCLAEHGIE